MRSSEAAAFALVLCACGSAPPLAVPAPASLAWTVLASGTSESLRGLSVPSPDVIWASGAHGAIVRSIDGGAHFEARVIDGTSELDFRSLHAFDADHAVVLSAGSPARAFVTSDGGRVWTETYTREGEGVFFDSIAFRDANEGVAIGDPLPSESPRFALIATHDGGRTWEERVGPPAEPGEAAFAASNACLAFPASGVTIFASGGAAPRTLRSMDGGASWSSASVPMAGSPSAGIFAIAFRDARIGYAVGGDYAAPGVPGGFARTSDGGERWQAGASPRGYRSSIAIGTRALIVVGTSGSDVSDDEGARWSPIDDLPLNTVRVRSDVAFAVGPEGRIAHLPLR